jgi:hypothetical protein
MTLRGKHRIVLLACAWLIASSVLACKLPVFRYALERWQVDRYRMVAVVDEQTTDAVGGALAELQAYASANVDVEIIDLSSLTDEQLWQVEEISGDTQTPLLQVFYPERNGQRKKCWEGELKLTAVRDWFESPLRRQITADIVSGVSVVWILVEGSDDQENQRIGDIVTSALNEAESQITIPEGVIPRAGASQFLRQHPDASMDDVLRSDIPLGVEFALRRLIRADQNESALRAMIGGLSSEDDGPVLVPVFGRGRILDAIPTESVSQQTIINACRYMVGECSCTVKALNPGVDLVLNVDWQEKLGPSVVVVNQLDSTEIKSAEPMLVAIPSGNSGVSQPAEKETGLPWIVLTVLAGLIAYGLHRRRRVTSQVVDG